jgi:hypothetical protein
MTSRFPVVPLRTTFETHGCTWWPDGNYHSCWATHDLAYWHGGSWRDRLAADRELAACVLRVRGMGMAAVMYVGVRFGGAFFWPVPWRFGYGLERWRWFWGLVPRFEQPLPIGEAT